MKPNTSDSNALTTRPVHTSGPWKVVAADDYYISADSYPAHDASRYARDNTDKALALIGNQTADCGEANAHLIAAAPDMLAALKFVKEFFRKMEDHDLPGDPLIEIRRKYHAPVHAQLDAAIALAEGRA